VIGEQANGRRDRRIAHRIREAGFAESKTLADFDWQFNAAAIDRVRIEALAGGEFIGRHQSLVWVGQSGVGKKSSDPGDWPVCLRAGLSGPVRDQQLDFARTDGCASGPDAAASVAILCKFDLLNPRRGWFRQTGTDRIAPGSEPVVQADQRPKWTVDGVGERTSTSTRGATTGAIHRWRWRSWTRVVDGRSS